jgi:hypothetical protein
MDPLAVLPLHSFVLSILTVLCLYAFARRLGGVRSIATLAVILFVFGAGLGWVATLARIDTSHDLFGTLANAPWSAQAQADLHIRFFNPYFAFLMSQRAYLYGLPLAMLVVTLLVRAARRHATRTFVLAGVVAGLLPLAHLPTLLALAMVTPFLALLLAGRPWHLRSIPWRGWIVFHVVWVPVAVPQLLMQLGGGAGALASFRLDLGWVASPDPWWWFWLKNLGLFIPLGLLALGAHRILPPRSHRVLLAFMPIFVVANTFAFQPWDWDNHKILIYFFLALTILVAALLVRAWRSSRLVVVRLLLVGVVVTMTLGPALENLDQLEGHGQYLMLTTEQLQLAAEIRAVTDPKALLVGGMQPQDPIMELTGRRLLMGYWGQLWVSGIAYQQRQADVGMIYAMGPGADSLLRQYKVDYVVIGPTERSALKANEAAYAARFPVVASTANYRVYDVRSLRTGG